MSVLKYFKNTPGRPHRATGLKCNFFFQIHNKVPGRKKKRPCRPRPTGDRGLSPVGGVTGASMSFEPVIFRHSLYHLSIKIQEKTEG